MKSTDDKIQQRLDELHGFCQVDTQVRLLQLIEAAKDLFNWYYIFGEDNVVAREHLAKLGNAIKKYENHEV